MLVTFDPAIISMFCANRLPHNRTWAPAVVRTVGPAEMARQLEGIWMDCRSLSIARRRAFIQLVAHYREVEPQRSRLNYLLGDRELDSQAVAMVDDLAACHAHVATVTIALIEKAKAANGVLPSTEFYWARKDDPAFWLMINGYGRPKHSADIAGAFAHFAYEQAHGRSVETYFEDCSVT
jgi:hypothetical protein